ncbi:hypothetical protein [Humibacter ginsenosidimutans]|uniref:Uncharacterized protein n=1 Tax=Humibacter ginsenosidimutans TaxID=2599293 RepID=A0A5B8M2P4_9MICO|nr:hypothetical protein [Humibacter ginsenosidimutans]QDZ15058.1 hypothetical protein FPZ11_09995 [Humibacter ginsenosidimutans]
MTAIAGRYGTAIPRDKEHPRAFRTSEFFRGVAIAYAVFQPIGAVILGVGSGLGNPSYPDGGIGAALLAGALFWLIGGVVVSAVATVVGVPFAYLLGRSLIRVRHDWVHVLAFLAFGLSLGLAIEYVFSFGSGPFGTLLDAWSPLRAYTWACGFVVVVGWWTTSRLALSKDARALVSAEESNRR